LADSIANYRVKNTLDLFKKVIGYYYTYRVLFLTEEKSLLDLEVYKLYEIITDPKAITLIKKSDTTKNEDIRSFAVEIKYFFQKIYSHTNTFLSRRNILPKIKQRQLMDFTLI
jgi:hypothetical protein